MSLLEDRILRILELRLSNLTEIQIAQNLGLGTGAIKAYEDSAKERIEALIAKGITNLEELAREVELSPISLNLFISYYKIEIPKRGSKKRPMKKRRGYRKAEVLEKIRECIETEDSIEAIAEKIGLSPLTIRQYASRYKISLSKFRDKAVRERLEQITTEIGKRSSSNIRIQQIKSLVEKGIRDKNQLSVILGISPSTVMQYASRAGISLRIHRNQRAEKIREVLKGGVSSIGELCGEIGIRPSALPSYQKEYNLDFSKLKEVKIRPEIDRLIEKGLSLNQIGKEVGRSREAIRQYINYTGQYNKWKDKRRLIWQKDTVRRKVRRKVLEEILSITNNLLAKRAQEAGLEYEKAVELYLSKKVYGKPLHIEKIIELFRRYKEAKNKNIHVSLNELGKSLGFSDSYTRELLLKAGLPFLYKPRKRKLISDKEKEAIKKGLNLKMSSADLAYFVGVGEHIITVARKGTGQHHKPILRTWMQTDQYILTYRLASKIYESVDLGFNNKETAELLGTHEKIVDYALKNRKSLSDILIHALKTLYPNQEMNKPYLQQSKSNLR